ncbi:MAG: 7-carboxy-7-deazaguanine synthase [Planctomycetaceae bacterium]|nr:7-carboxy-7-deazaguanine synthase [Planctomycetaceae bacterium]
MTYSVKEVYYTLQGEGANTGRPAVFCRFTGCNLWSGREEDRSASVCWFCDTDFIGTDGPGGGAFDTADAIADRITSLWCPNNSSERLVVCTGGEPLLQLDEPMIGALHERGFDVAVETNGTKPIPTGVDWVCVSPKPGSEIVVHSGDELKLVHPQEGVDPAKFEDWDFKHFFLQPIDGPDRERNIGLTADYCLGHPRWRLSLQIHKLIGLA